MIISTPRGLISTRSSQMCNDLTSACGILLQETIKGLEPPREPTLPIHNHDETNQSAKVSVPSALTPLHCYYKAERLLVRYGKSYFEKHLIFPSFSAFVTIWTAMRFKIENLLVLQSSSQLPFQSRNRRCTVSTCLDYS